MCLHSRGFGISYFAKIHAVILEYAETGLQQKSEFDCARFAPIYHSHLETITAFCTDEPDTWAAVSEDIANGAT
jgi:hypothetical protein